ncbi:tail fiber protein [Bradyrhizobium septentrionale]|uniref:phage tail protein n=1 Tax=Bradyrhizobium septentrionale TaxID=1404411 RepID=UPI0030CC7259
MGQPYIGEIRMFGGNFAPNGWMFCQGQLLAISENDALFNLIGTTYGGDGQSTFALPNLQGRLPLHQGNSFVMGQSAGVEQVTLTTQQLPIHNHPMSASLNNATGSTVTGNVVGVVGATQIYREAPGRVANGEPGLLVGRRQPAARQHAALPLRQLHHFTVRHLSEPKLGRDHV